MKRIGILGGMGPAASAQLYTLLVHGAQQDYAAVQDTDYPEIVLYSLGLEGFDETGIVDEALVFTQLVQGIAVLVQAGCDFVIMACNTIHYFIDQLREKSSVPILSIVEETAKVVQAKAYTHVGLLSSQTTTKLGLYTSFFAQEDITYYCPPPNGQKNITQLIFEIMGGKTTLATKQAVLQEITKMQQKGAQALVLGCTELPLAISSKDVTLPVYDTLTILAKATLAYAYGGEER